MDSKLKKSVPELVQVLSEIRDEIKLSREAMEREWVRRWDEKQEKEKRKKVLQVMEATGASEKTAIKSLEAYNYDLTAAVERIQLQQKHSAELRR